jgi:hypothetical protein
MKLVANCVAEGRYLDTRHAHQRQIERNIIRSDILFVLLHGFHEKKKDKFDDVYHSWNYAIRGKTINSVPIRVVVSFDESGMLIITAIKLNV